jgi:hypothetical protein
VIRRIAILIGVSAGGAALAAVPLGLRYGEYQWWCAGIAIGLVVPPGVLTLLLAGRLARGTHFGPLVALAMGTVVRLGISFGGGVAVFLANRSMVSSDPFSFLAWLLGVYLAALTVETVLLAGLRAGDRASRAAVPPNA